MLNPSSSRRSFAFVALATSVNVLVSAGYSVAGLIETAGTLPDNRSAHIFALYAAARAVPLAALTLFAIWRGWRPVLLAVAWLAVIIQLLDASVGLEQADVGKTVGPIVLATIGVGTLLLCGRSYRELE